MLRSASRPLLLKASTASVRCTFDQRVAWHRKQPFPSRFGPYLLMHSPHQTRWNHEKPRRNHQNDQENATGDKKDAPQSSESEEETTSTVFIAPFVLILTVLQLQSAS
ncbi:hypothetical protein G7Y89_g11745 [Cudoniella acicularis]|uniref:Uncharacterized protein n=1 Tax=Cudoniella acicularis TaxID=354080 RepID=A0A8H4RBT1_9HELO|nr:hypothetical protein G7Y89_g11745 [Cudoniella acicularis]